MAVEMFNPLEEYVFLNKNTLSALVHPVEVRKEEEETSAKKTKEAARKITTKTTLPEELQKMSKDIQFDLDDKEKRQWRQLLEKLRDVFQLDGQPLGRTQLIQHEIHTSSSPICQPPRMFPIGLREEGEKQIEEIMKKDVIKLSSSPWASPVVSVKKKDVTYRFCVDYRKLKSVTKKDSFPLPRIDDTLDALAGARCLSTLDLASSYWKVGLTGDAEEKIVFANS